MAESGFDFLLDYLVQLMKSDHKFVLNLYEQKLIEKDQFEWLYREMQFLGMFLKDSEEKFTEQKQVKKVATKIIKLTYGIEDFIDSLLLENVLDVDGGFPDYSPDSIEEYGGFPEYSRDMTEEYQGSPVYSWYMTEDYEGSPDYNRGMTQQYKGFPECSRDMTQQYKGSPEYSRDMTEEYGGFPEYGQAMIEKYGGFPKYSRAMIEEHEDVIVQEEDVGTPKNTGDIIVPKFSRKKFGVPWQRKFITGSSRKVKIVVQKIKSLMAKKTPLFGKMKNVGEEIESDHAEGTTHQEMMKNVWEDIKSDHVDGMIRQEKMKNVLEDTMSDHVDGIIYQDFDSISKEIESIKTEVMEIYEKKKYGIKVLQTEESSSGAASNNARPQWTGEDTIVGIDDEKNAIMDLLTAEHGKQLKVISIVGMPGLGKTAFARLVYSDPLIVYHFDIRAWTYVSQVHRRKDSLVDILRSGFQLRDKISEMDDKSLGEELYKRLKGRRYLIVMDDIWNIGAWNELKTYFPNDNNGSRVIFTSRLAVVAGNAKPYYLRFLSEDESWDLLQKKIFRKESCPQELIEIGRQIAKKCQGLPLAILVISGPLAKGNTTQKWWKQVAERLRSYDIVSDPEQYMDTLAMSYNYLPNHLKACFLYFGAFPEDYEIHVWKLIWLWIAEGLIRWNEQKSLEEVAEDYFMDLIDRSLVIVSKIGSDGRVKTCCIHDLLHDLCLRKAQEIKFLQQISRYQQTSFFSSRPEDTKQRRMSIHSNIFHNTSFLNKLHVRSLLSFGSSFYNIVKAISFVCESSKLLRVLDLSSFEIFTIPKAIMQLVHLRYLALRFGAELEFPLSISHLWNLETLIVEGSKGSLVLSHGAWDTVKLRHLSSRLLISIEAPKYGINHFKLDNLQTLRKLDLSDQSVMKLLRGSPNLKKLEYHGVMPRLDFLIHLETLKVHSFWWTGRHCLNLNMFPLTLKSLTLSSMELDWEEMTILGSLPNLEVLKLLAKAFMGARWDTGDVEFYKLRFLKFQRLGIVQWNASSEHFPNLQTLVLDDCSLLKEIPSSFGDIVTLDMIRLRYCSQSAEISARQIQEQQQSMGNDGFKILIHSYHNTV